MPTNSPITATPMPILSDTPNIESATHPGFTHLERFAIPRFSSAGGRNLAYSGITPALGEMTYIQNLGFLGYQVWNGSAWEEYGEFTRLRDRTVLLPASVERESATSANISGLSLPVTPGIYKLAMDLHYGGEGTAEYGLNFTFPGALSRITVGAIARGQDATGNARNGTLVFHDTNGTRVSGGVEDLIFGCFTFGNGLLATVHGTVTIVGSSGTFQAQHRRVSGSTGRIITFGDGGAGGGGQTLMSLRRVG